MIFDNIEFHNVAELRGVSRGRRLQRVPEDVRLCLNQRAQEKMLSPAGSEIRFVSSGAPVRVTVSCPEGTAEAIPFWGPFQGKERFRIGLEPQVLELVYPERLKKLDEHTRDGLLYSPKMCRLTLRGDGLVYHGIEGEGLRPPTVDEVPKLRYLSYGTSITHGSSATAMHLTYVRQVAWRLGADLINFGVGGAAHCEKELSDYLAQREDWDIATLALSVNMVGGFSVEAFTKRVEYMVNTVAGANTARPVACISIFPHFRDFCVDEALTEKTETFRQVLRDAVRICPHPNVHLLEGPDMLTDKGGLSVDLIHPGDFGMIEMGERIAGRLKGLIGS
jgi:lysophospholipase L1-like esterase